jgi:hypothetical protein
VSVRREFIAKYDFECIETDCVEVDEDGECIDEECVDRGFVLAEGEDVIDITDDSDEDPSTHGTITTEGRSLLELSGTFSSRRLSTARPAVRPLSSTSRAKTR